MCETLSHKHLLEVSKLDLKYSEVHFFSSVKTTIVLLACTQSGLMPELLEPMSSHYERRISCFSTFKNDCRCNKNTKGIKGTLTCSSFFSGMPFQ